MQLTSSKNNPRRMKPAFANKWMVWVLGAIGIVLIAVAIVTVHRLWLYHKGKPLFDVPEMSIMPVEIKPVHVAAKKAFDLGYCHGALPASIEGDITFVGEGNTVICGDNGLTFMRPVDGGSIYSELLASYQMLSGQKVEVPYEFHKMFLNQKPLTLGDYFVKSSKDLIGAAIFAMAKGLSASNSTMIKIMENKNMGVIAYIKPEIIMIEVFDLRTDYQQVILVEEKKAGGKIDEIMSTLVEDLEIVSGKSE